MSKRYREVLQDVETRHSRRAREAAAVAAATADGARRRDERATPATPGGTPAADATETTESAVGGVATLVRPAPSSARDPRQGPRSVARPRTGSLAAPLDERGERRPGRPGNGPADADQPLVFAWRGRRYDVTRILGHWREEEGWWRRPDGEPIRIEQSDLWRVEAVRNGGVARDQCGVYELSRRGDAWRLDRVWD